MKPKELIKIMKKDGWQVVRVEGSHHMLKHAVKGDVVIPLHNKDLKPGILNNILKKAGLK